jgi:hypothetical protein
MRAVGTIIGVPGTIRCVSLDGDWHFGLEPDDHPEYAIGDQVTVEFDPQDQFAKIVDEPANSEPTKTIVCNQRSYDVPIDVYIAFEKMRCQLAIVANHLACVNDVESRELLESVKWALK